MESVSIIRVDISKRSFQLHGATAEGKPVFRKMLSRGKFLSFLAKVPPCVVVMEACGGAHFWGRQIIALGHACKLMPTIYLKPFVKRQKNDANDAEGSARRCGSWRSSRRKCGRKLARAEFGVIAALNAKIVDIEKTIRARARAQ